MTALSGLFISILMTTQPASAADIVPPGSPPVEIPLAPEEKETILAVRAFGADVRVGKNGRANAITFEPSFPGSGLTADLEKVLERLSHLPELERFTFGCVRLHLTDNGLAFLGRLKKLKSLEIYSSEVTDDGLKGLNTLDRLESLTLG
jgi:hypothetical protein